MRRREASRLKAGDKVRLNPNLKEQRIYAGISYWGKFMHFNGDMAVKNPDKDGIVRLKNGYNYSHLMLVKA